IDNLIGNRTDLLETVSLEKQVTDKTPPSFIWASDKDPSVPCQNSIMFKEALESCGVRAELHLYDSKVHGISLASREVMKPGVSYNPDVSDWPERADRFLQSVLGPVF
ncbi:MAG: hypothetical protein II753_05415, partial [Spirochaetales bacterium]|nr:hypothetical protein [Spirochaetales bacterium]